MNATIARLLATGFGELMVLTALTALVGPVPPAGNGVPGVSVAVALGVGAIVVVPVAIVFRPAATAAVLLTVAVIAWAGIPAAPTVICGLCAAAFLVLSHTTAVTGVTVGAVGCFTLVGLVAVMFPARLPWSPLLGPPAVFAGYLLAVRPFLGQRE